MFIISSDDAPVVRAAASAPAWRVWLQDALAQRLEPPAAAPAASAFVQGIAVAFRPLLAHAYAEWLRGAGAGPREGVDLAAIEQQWIELLAQRLCHLSLRTLTLELQVAKLQGRLTAQDGAARFAEFFTLLAQPQALREFFDEYPALAELLVTACRSWVSFGVQVLDHLRADAPQLERTFGWNLAADPLVRLKASGADAHRGGRCVLFAHRASGRRVVYKPRPSTLDLHFQELLGWIAERDARFSFRTPAVLACGAHGWFEYVERAPCTDAAEARSFFRRQGEYLALFHALDATDLHYENVMACGSHPVIVDLEALFHPSLFVHHENRAFDQALTALHDSVLRVGLLPWRVGAEGGGQGADIGGISAPADQLSPRPVLMAQGIGTDDMHLVRQRTGFGGDGHRVMLADGSLPDLLEHADDVAQGFEAMYGFLRDHGPALLAADGPMARFRGDTTRVILRPTSIYAQLLQESLHPDLLRDPRDRQQFVGRLREALPGVADSMRSMVSAAVECEVADVLMGDIPLFSGGYDSCGLLDSCDRPLPGLLPQAPSDRVHERLQHLGPVDFALQQWVLRSSLATLGSADVTRRTPRSAQRRALGPLPSRRVLRANALEAARKIAGRIAALAFRGAGGATWLGMNADGLETWGVGPLQGDLYSGQAGVILFLAYLDHIVGGDAATRELVEAAAASWLSDMRTSAPKEQAVGGFVGLGGSLFLLNHLAHLWQRPALLDDAQTLMELLPARIETDTLYDVLAGSAGCIAALLGWCGTVHHDRALALAIQCGDHLIDCAQPQAQGWGWPARGSEPALGGFSHGAAGVAWALDQLAQATAAPRFREAAAQALAFDRTLHDIEKANWRDLRQRTDEADTRLVFQTNWCHGAPGIGLARMAMRRNCDDSLLDDEIGTALQTTLRQGFGGSHCLCHGALGNLELLWSAAHETGAASPWQRRADRQLARVLDDLATGGLQSGLPLNVESPGLMTGLSGVGLGLLRAARPDRVPSVLLLEPPRTGGERR